MYTKCLRSNYCSTYVIRRDGESLEYMLESRLEVLLYHAKISNDGESNAPPHSCPQRALFT